jgi:hypothetical protein
VALEEKEEQTNRVQNKAEEEEDVGLEKNTKKAKGERRRAESQNAENRSQKRRERFQPFVSKGCPFS